MRPIWPVLLVLLAIPAADACSLAARSFDSATFDLEDGDLWYVDGAASLRRQHGALDLEVEDAFFLSFAPLPGEALLVAGQDGLGADCSGLDWLELRRDGQVVWRRDGRGGDGLTDATLATRAVEHPLGPFAQVGGRLWRLDGDALVEVGRPRAGTWLLGFDAEGRPVETAGQDVYIGDLHLPMAPTGYPMALAVGDGTTALVERVDWSVTVVHLVQGDQVRNVTWTPPDGWEPTAAWSDALVVSAGGRAYRVAGDVTDLGMEGVVAVAARGQHTAVFTEDGYTVFDGTQPIETWTRRDGTWTPGAVPATRPSQVEADRGPVRVLEEAPADATAGGADDGKLGIPSAGLAGLALAVAGAALARRRVA